MPTAAKEGAPVSRSKLSSEMHASIVLGEALSDLVSRENQAQVAIIAREDETAQRIYDAVGIDLTADARSAMTQWLADDSREKLATHRYTAEDFGLSREQIREKFAAYTERFIEPHGEKN